MAVITQQTHFELGARELLRLADMRDHLLVCEAGEIWVTSAGDARDIILRPGDSWRVDSSAEVAVSAFVASALRVEHRQALGSAADGARRFLLSRRGWAFPPLAAFPVQLIR